MTDEEKKELRAIVSEVVKEIMAKLRPMPVSAPSPPVTEIVIRSGAPETVQMLGGRGVPYCPCPCRCPYFAPDEAASLDDKRKELLQGIKGKTGEEPEKVVQRLENEVRVKMLASAIEDYARKLGVE